MSLADASQEERTVPVAFGSTVTILFSDIRGFTEYTDRHGDEAAYRMLQHHNNLVQEQIALYSGHIVKTLGDSFMVSFDAARTAVICAKAMQRAVAQSNLEEHGPKVQIGIGINTGEPVRDAGDLFGGAVNLASRICAEAGPGQVLVSETVRRVVGRMADTEYVDRGFFQLKGLQEPQHLFEIAWSGTVADKLTQADVASEPTRPSEAHGISALLVKARRRPMLLWSGGVAAVLLLVGIASSAVLLGGFSGDQPSPPAQAGSASGAGSPDRLLLNDDFSDPMRGLFQDSRRGTSRGTYGDGTVYEYEWEYGYADRALVFRLKGPSPGQRQPVFPYEAAAAADKVIEDFAIEMRARATKTPERARYAIDYVVMGEDRYRFEVAPGPGQYGLSLGPLARNFMASGKSSLVNRGDEENLLRMEVRGSTMKVFLNGQVLDQAQHEGLARRGGTIELVMGMFGPPTEAAVEVRIIDFKVYSLAP